jgi:hypothetical protein
VTGADAFIESDIFYPNGVKVYKRSLPEIEPFFDLVMLHHSFEHLPDPRESCGNLQSFAARVNLSDPDSGRAFAWEKYGVNWVQLDAPRHLFLYTERSFRLLAKKPISRSRKSSTIPTLPVLRQRSLYARNMAHERRNGTPTAMISREKITPSQIRDWEREAEI